MIYELRITQVRPRGVPEFEKRLEAALPARERHSKLAACWHTEIGPLNHILELWPYDDRQHLNEAAKAVAQDGGWPSVAGDLVQSVQVEILNSPPFNRPLTGEPQKLGPFYELRSYQVRTGGIPEMIEKWGPMIAPREALSPCVGCWYNDTGRWFHLWPYENLVERGRIRDEAARKKLWSPPTAHLLLNQWNWVMLPAAFSPLQ